MIKTYKQLLFVITTMLLFTACSIKEPEIVTTEIKNSDIELLASSADDTSIDP